jgi:hypothetical protein
VSSLREFQRDFARAIYGRGNANVAAQLGATPARRMDVYRRNTFGNLHDALQSAYPVITKLVGEDFFRYAAREYVYLHPSTSGDLHEFGAEFGAFFAAFPPARGLPYLPDVAALEWACHRSFFAADHDLLDFERLGAVPPQRYGELKFRLHPACRLVVSAFPVDRIWHANQDGAPEVIVDLGVGGVRALVSRRFHRVVVHALPVGYWLFLLALATGQALDTACATAAQADPEFELAEALQRAVLDGVLVDFQLS